MKQALARRVGDTRSLKRLSYGRTTSAFQRLASSRAAERSRWAGLVNATMVIMACGAFHDGHREVTDIGAPYRTLTPLFGSMARRANATDVDGGVRRSAGVR